MSYFARRGAAFVLGVAVVGLAAGVIHDATGDDPTTDRASLTPVSSTHLRAHETPLDLVCRLLLDKKKDTHIK